jgi:Cof subfamily protein (haloacid dehalogenase superfamily)
MTVELPDASSDLDDILAFANTRLIAFDLDGTLLNSVDTVPGPRIQQLQRSIKAYGVRVTIATGRALKGAYRVIDAFGGLKSVPVILYNGSVVIDVASQRLIMSRAIDPVASQAVLNLVSVSKCRGFFYQFETSVLPESFDERWPETAYFLGEGLPPPEFNGLVPQIATASDLSGRAFTAILILPSSQEQAADLAIALDQIEGLSVTSSGSRYIELRPNGSNKETGIAELAKILKIGPTDVVAVGDNDNDVELLAWAGIGVTVAGASTAAKAAATHHSRHGAERAAIEVLSLIRTAKRLKKGKTGEHNE